MLTRDEAVRCAHAAVALRPDWTIDQLMHVLGDDRVRPRPLPHVAVALAWIASDEETRTPGRLLARGPWWDACRPAKTEVAAPAFRAYDPMDCRICGYPRDDHHIAALADHDYEPAHTARATPPPDDVRAELAQLRPPAAPTTTEETA